MYIHVCIYIYIYIHMYIFRRAPAWPAAGAGSAQASPGRRSAS